MHSHQSSARPHDVPPSDQTTREAEIIEAHLHLLLDGRDDLAVFLALRKALRAHHPNIAVVNGLYAQEITQELLDARSAAAMLMDVHSDHTHTRAVRELIEYVNHIATFTYRRTNSALEKLNETIGKLTISKVFRSANLPKPPSQP